jgi:predicted RNase H-like nuclease (RuvC/YqgF family)
VPEAALLQQAVAADLAQFHYLGFVRTGEEWQKKQEMAVLTKNDDLHVVKAGETIDKHVVVKAITRESVTLVDRESRLEYTVLLSEEPEAPVPAPPPAP